MVKTLLLIFSLAANCHAATPYAGSAWTRNVRIVSTSTLVGGNPANTGSYVYDVNAINVIPASNLSPNQCVQTNASSQLTSSGSACGGGGLSGGTANYVPLWTGSSSLGLAPLYQTYSGGGGNADLNLNVLVPTNQHGKFEVLADTTTGNPGEIIRNPTDSVGALGTCWGNDVAGYATNSGKFHCTYVTNAGDFSLGPQGPIANLTMDHLGKNFTLQSSVAGSTLTLSAANVVWVQGQGNTKVGILTGTPAYTLDVAGDINTGGVYRVNGTPISSGGGGGASTLAISTGSSSQIGSPAGTFISSPTAVINFNSTQFYGSLNGGATAFMSLNPVSLSTGVTDTLQAAQFPALTGDITTPGGSLATAAASVQGNITTFTQPITYTSTVTINSTNVSNAALTVNGNVVVQSTSTTGADVVVNVLNQSGGVLFQISQNGNIIAEIPGSSSTGPIAPMISSFTVVPSSASKNTTFAWGCIPGSTVTVTTGGNQGYLQYLGSWTTNTAATGSFIGFEMDGQYFDGESTTLGFCNTKPVTTANDVFINCEHPIIAIPAAGSHSFCMVIATGNAADAIFIAQNQNIAHSYFGYHEP